MYVIDAACFDECFLFHAITGRCYFFKKFDVTVRFFQPSYCRFIWNESLERSPYFTLYPNKIPVLILILVRRSKIKLSYTISIHTWKTLVADFFYDNVFYSLYFLTAWHFFYKWVGFFWKTSKHLWKHLFTWYCRTFINSLLFIKGYISKLHSMMTYILMSWFIESTERQKSTFLKETVVNADLHKALLNKTITIQEQYLKYDFAAPLNLFRS